MVVVVFVAPMASERRLKGDSTSVLTEAAVTSFTQLFLLGGNDDDDDGGGGWRVADCNERARQGNGKRTPLLHHRLIVATTVERKRIPTENFHFRRALAKKHFNGSLKGAKQQRG